MMIIPGSVRLLRVSNPQPLIEKIGMKVDEQESNFFKLQKSDIHFSCLKRLFQSRTGAARVIGLLPSAPLHLPFVPSTPASSSPWPLRRASALLDLGTRTLTYAHATP